MAADSSQAKPTDLAGPPRAKRRSISVRVYIASQAFFYYCVLILGYTPWTSLCVYQMGSGNSVLSSQSERPASPEQQRNSHIIYRHSTLNDLVNYHSSPAKEDLLKTLSESAPNASVDDSGQTLDTDDGRLNIQDGKHKYKFSNGDIYYGEWKDGKMHGKGCLTVREHGAVYDGYFENNEFQGKGTFVYKNGNIFKGNFLRGKRHGKGHIDMKDGSSLKGVWENGILVQEGNEQPRTS